MRPSNRESSMWILRTGLRAIGSTVATRPVRRPIRWAISLGNPQFRPSKTYKGSVHLIYVPDALRFSCVLPDFVPYLASHPGGKRPSWPSGDSFAVPHAVIVLVKLTIPPVFQNSIISPDVSEAGPELAPEGDGCFISRATEEKAATYSVESIRRTVQPVG